MRTYYTTVRTHTHVDLPMHTHTCTHTNSLKCIRPHTHLHTHADKHTHTHKRLCTHTFTRIVYKHTHCTLTQIVLHLSKKFIDMISICVHHFTPKYLRSKYNSS